MEVPLVCIDVQRAGPATGVPTKTEQGDLWQVLGAGQGDYPRIIVAPNTILDCFKTVPELFNLVDKFQCPGIILSDLLISEGRSSVDPNELSFAVPIDRGALITSSISAFFGHGRSRWVALGTAILFFGVNLIQSLWFYYQPRPGLTLDTAWLASSVVNNSPAIVLNLWAFLSEKTEDFFDAAGPKNLSRAP